MILFRNTSCRKIVPIAVLYFLLANDYTTFGIHQISILSAIIMAESYHVRWLLEISILLFRECG